MNESTETTSSLESVSLADQASVDLTVVGGAGHVGLPLALVFAHKGQTVMINDRDATTLDKIHRGQMPFIEAGAQELLDEALADQRLTFSSSASAIPANGPVILTIGTPVDKFLNPVYSVMQECIDSLLPQLSDGQLLVLRSTVYPGTTTWLGEYIGKQGRNVKLAFCPERVVQGLGIKELQEMPQIVSGVNKEAEDEAAELFGLIAPDIVRVKPIEAELAKLFNNVYRYIQFATSNEFYMIARSAGADYYAILDAMTRNYPRAADIPSAGLTAGPCLFKDTMQLSAYARSRFSLGNSAMLVNEGLVLYLVEELRRDRDLSATKVGLLGMAFKPDIDDVRASLSYKLKNALKLHAKEVLTTDPLVTTDPALLPLDRVIEECDVLILCVPHSAYRGLDLKGKPVVDVWNFFGTGGGEA